MPITTITILTTRNDYDNVVAKAEDGTPTVIYVSHSPSPTCKDFTNQYEQVAADISADPVHSGIVFCQMEYEKETSPMMKFGPQHMPVVVLIMGQKARTLLSPRAKELRDAVRDVFGA